MKRFLFLLVALIGFVATGATITGPVLLSYSNSPYVGPILFRPLSTPLPYTPNLITGGDFTVRPATNGTFSVELQPGNYRVQVGADRAFVIDVPTNAATYTLLERITNSLSWNSSISPRTNSYATANDTIEGVVRTYTTQGAPVVWTTNDTPIIGSYLGYRHYETIAAMLADAAPVGTSCYVNLDGRDSKNDGGGGEFTFIHDDSSSVTNTGTIFAWGSGRVHRAWDNANAKVEWFGGFANDDLNDTPAIQSAANLIYSLKRGNVVFGGGLYHLESPVWIPYRVNLMGVSGWKYTELASVTTTSDQYLLGGATQLRAMNTFAGEAMFIMNSTDGYVRQSSETLEDGEVVDSRFQETAIENLVFNGNAANLTAYTHGILARSKWNITVKNCGFILLRGRPIYFHDVNGAVVDTIWMKGDIGNRPNSGMWIYSTADSIFNNITAFGFRGPAIWLNGATTGVNIGGNWLLGNSVVTNTEYTVSSVSSGQWTLSGTPWLKTGDHVEMRTTGTLPTGFDRFTLYYLTEISSGIYGVHTNYSLATNGVYLTTSGSGTGTHSFTIGPASGVYLSGGANNNAFQNIRVDQCSGPGMMFRNAQANAINGGILRYNTGVHNLETIATNDMVGLRFDAFASQNTVIGMTIAYQEIGTQFFDNASQNLVGSQYNYVTQNVDNEGTHANDTYVRESGGYVEIGGNTNQVALKLSGNASGVRLLQMYRNDLPQQSEIGVQDDGFTFWNGTDSLSVGSFVGTATESRLRLGSTVASPRTGYISGETGSGTDAQGSNVRIEAGPGTGASTTNGKIEFLTPDATSSGTASQATTVKVNIGREGQLGLYGRTAAPTTVANGEMWLRTDTDKVELRARGTNQYVLTSQVAELNGHFSWANNAPQWTVAATNLSSGFRLNVTGGDASSGTIRFQTNGTTMITLFGEGRIGLRNDMTSDSSFLSDGQIWYRSDTDKFRVRYNSTTANIATEDWVTANFTPGAGLADGDYGDITVSGTGTAINVDNDAITYAKMQNVSAASKLLGRGDSGSGDVQEITIGSGLTMTGTTLSSSGGAGVSDGDKGDITISGSGTVYTVDAGVVTLAKMANLAQDQFIGRVTASTGVPETATITAAARTVLDDTTTSAMRTTLGLAIGTDVQAQDAELAALAAVTSAADTLAYFSGSGTATTTPLTTAGRALLDDASASAQRTTLGLVIGTDVQAIDAELTSIAGLTSAADRLPYYTGSGTAALATFTAAGRALVDDADATAQRTTLGLGTVATESTVPIAKGGTGATTASAAYDALQGAETTVASATTTDLGAVASDKVSITGTTTITGFGTVAAGVKREGRFTGALTLTHNATSLILPGNASITTAAGDRFQAYSLGSGNWVISSYTKADGTAVVGGSGSVATDTIWDAAGDLVVGTGANTAARLAPPTQLSGSTLYYGPSGVEWVNPATHYTYRNDFLTSSTITTDWGNNNSGGSTSFYNSETGAVGILAVLTGTGTTGYRHQFLGGNNAFFLGNGRTIITWKVRLQNLSDATDTFTAYVGLYDHWSTVVDGVWFEYSHGVNSGKWECKVSDNSAQTITDSGVTATTTLTTFLIDVNAGATEAKFYINGSLVHTESGANIPQTARSSNIGWGITKSAGTTTRGFNADYVDVYVKY